MFFTNYISIFFVRQLTRWWNSIIFFLISNLPYHRPLLLLFLHHLQDQIGKCGTFHILLSFCINSLSNYNPPLDIRVDSILTRLQIQNSNEIFDNLDTFLFDVNFVDLCYTMQIVKLHSMMPVGVHILEFRIFF